MKKGLLVWQRSFVHRRQARTYFLQPHLSHAAALPTGRCGTAASPVPAGVAKRVAEPFFFVAHRKEYALHVLLRRMGVCRGRGQSVTVNLGLGPMSSAAVKPSGPSGVRLECLKAMPRSIRLRFIVDDDSAASTAIHAYELQWRLQTSGSAAADADEWQSASTSLQCAPPHTLMPLAACSAFALSPSLFHSRPLSQRPDVHQRCSDARP